MRFRPERRALRSWSGRGSRSPTRRRGSRSRAAGSPSSAARAATAATASSPRRLLAQRGYAVELGLLGRRDALKGDPALAAARYPGPVLDAAAVDLASADCVIDALFGAGLARDIDGEAKAIIERINAFTRAGGRVLAVDVPSGIDGETGKVRGVAVEASASVTFFRLKPGHLLCRGARCAARSGSPTLAFPKPRLPPSRRKPSSMRRPSGARRCRARTRRATNMRAARCSSCRAPAITRAPPGSPPARLCASGAGIVTRREPARRGRRQRRAPDRGDGRALRERPRVRGAARRRAAPRDRARPRRGRRARPCASWSRRR